jgi:hypothetical protein
MIRRLSVAGGADADVTVNYIAVLYIFIVLICIAL